MRAFHVMPLVADRLLEEERSPAFSLPVDVCAAVLDDRGDGVHAELNGTWSAASRASADVHTERPRVAGNTWKFAEIAWAF